MELRSVMSSLSTHGVIQELIYNVSDNAYVVRTD
jgi:hypothetical protein